MNNQVHTQIVSFIWSIADDCLRDVYVRGKYRDVILPMTVIRRLDAMLEGTIENVRNTKKLLDEATAVATDEPDTDLRDTENIPFTYEGGIEAFMQNEVLTYAPDAYIDEKKTQIGYEISFTKYFYKPVELREMSEIIESLNSLEKEADGMMADIMGGIR